MFIDKYRRLNITIFRVTSETLSASNVEQRKMEAEILQLSHKVSGF